MRCFAKTLIVLATVSTSAAAQPAQSEPARWISRWDHGECQLIRAVGDPLVERLALKVTPGTGFVALWVTPPRGSATPGGANPRVVVHLEPTGRRLQSDRVHTERYQGFTSYVLTLRDEPTLQALEAANGVSFEADGVRLLRMPLGNVRAGVDVLRQCANDQLRAWGIDPVMLSSLRARPVPAAGLETYLTPADYPEDALRTLQRGRSVIRLDIDAEGRVTGCATLNSSGHRALDERACLVLSRRARFRAAVDSAGEATAAAFVTHIDWRIRPNP